ncbi:hypothetical protein R3P38DRAFT_2933936 [Favolaschia claudopus]|uniref:Uncharacterized protein n=1 Tax=Favolaschia claudopus TaxID=2862362 RepID=A0AAW0BSE2_9AGAR
MASTFPEQVPRTVKKPRIAIWLPGMDDIQRTTKCSAPSPLYDKSSRTSAAHTTGQGAQITGPGGRKTRNSLASHFPVHSEALPPAHRDIQIPRAPSRSPTPPTQVILLQRGGSKFTEADRRHFIEFIQWRLSDDRTLTRSELCDQLSEKAPHHSARSWGSYWQRHHDLPDKILALSDLAESE